MGSRELSVKDDVGVILDALRASESDIRIEVVARPGKIPGGVDISINASKGLRRREALALMTCAKRAMEESGDE